MDRMIDAAACLSCAAAACYLWGRKMQRSADHLKSITRVTDLKGLDELLTEKPTNHLVVVSGRVGSEAPLNCKLNGLLGVLIEEKAELDVQIELEDGGLIDKSLKFLLHRKETPWYLEDNTGRANVMGAQDAVGFVDILKRYAFDMPANELFKRLAIPEDFKVLKHHCHGRVLSMDTFLTFVGEAVRDKAGNLMIQRPKEHSFLVYSGENSFDTMVDELKSESEVYSLLAQIFGAIAVGVAIIYGVDLIRRVWLPYEWEKKDEEKDVGNNISETTKTTKSDSADTHQREKSDIRRFRPLRRRIGLAYLVDC